MLLFTTVCACATPFHCTMEFASKPLPVSVTVACVPVTTFLGLTPVRTGVGLFTLKVVGFDTPPPGEGFNAVISFAELAASAEAGTEAFNSVALIKVVNAEPLRLTTEPDEKPVPTMSKVSAPEPAITEAGFTAASTGTRLFTVNERPEEMPPPGVGFAMATERLPAAPRLLDVGVQVICVGLT